MGRGIRERLCLCTVYAGRREGSDVCVDEEKLDSGYVRFAISRRYCLSRRDAKKRIR